MVPYTLDSSGMCLAASQDFNSGDPFHAFLREVFDVLTPDRHETATMLSIGMRCRPAG